MAELDEATLQFSAQAKADSSSSSGTDKRAFQGTRLASSPPAQGHPHSQVLGSRPVVLARRYFDLG